MSVNNDIFQEFVDIPQEPNSTPEPFVEKVSSQKSPGLKSGKKKTFFLVLLVLVFISLGAVSFYLVQSSQNTNGTQQGDESVEVVQDPFVESQEESQDPFVEESLPVESSGTTIVEETTTGTVIGDDISFDNVEEENLTSETVSSGNTLVQSTDSILGLTGSQTVTQVNTALLQPMNKAIEIDTNGNIENVKDSKPNVINKEPKEESTYVSSVATVSYIPSFDIIFKNTQTNYKVSDTFEIEFDIITNSKTLQYTITEKLVGDNMVFEIKPLEIKAPIVSLEENYKTHKVKVPLEMMTKGQHKIAVKVNNINKAIYSYIVQ